MNRMVGLYCAGVSLGLWIFLMLMVVLYLPFKLDTAVMLSWPVLPGVVGGLVFYRMDKNNEWDE